MAPTLRAATPADLPGIADTHRASVSALLPACYPLEMIEAWARFISPERHAAGWEKGRRYCVAEAAGRIAGFSAWLGAQVEAVYVHPDHVRGGLGARLLEEAEAALPHPEIFLDASLYALDFYLRRGWIGGERITVPIGDTGYRMDAVKMSKRRPL